MEQLLHRYPEANSFLENYSLEVLERFKWNVDYEIDVEKAKMRVHEVRALHLSSIWN